MKGQRITSLKLLPGFHLDLYFWKDTGKLVLPVIDKSRIIHCVKIKPSETQRGIAFPMQQKSGIRSSIMHFQNKFSAVKFW